MLLRGDGAHGARLPTAEDGLCGPSSMRTLTLDLKTTKVPQMGTRLCTHTTLNSPHAIPPMHGYTFTGARLPEQVQVCTRAHTLTGVTHMHVMHVRRHTNNTNTGVHTQNPRALTRVCTDRTRTSLAVGHGKAAWEDQSSHTICTDVSGTSAS